MQLLSLTSAGHGKTFALGAVLIAATLGLGATADRSVTHRLALHAVDGPGFVYFSAFHDGDIAVRFHDGKLHPIEFDIRARYGGCEWAATESLYPLDDTTFSYAYTETILSCRSGAPAQLITPRVGTVTVED